jgi:hypothetical protein
MSACRIFFIILIFYFYYKKKKRVLYIILKCIFAGLLSGLLHGLPNTLPRSTQSQRFQCKLCEKSYKKKSHLKIHTRNIHGDLSNPLACSDCGSFYKNYESLRNHKCIFTSN